MLTALETRSALRLVTEDATENGRLLLSRVTGSPDVRRAALLATAPALIEYFAEGSAALATDYYADTRAQALMKTAYVASPVIADRTVKIRRAIAWSAEPLFEGFEVDAAARLAEVIQYEAARPFRDTILTNRRRDAAAIGWRRITVGGCRFCRMLADRGAVYKEATVRFAAHPNCHCTAAPAFVGYDGPEASTMQYIASRRSRTQKQRDELRSYLNNFYQDFPG